MSACRRWWPSDPRFESWAIEQAQGVDGIELSDRQRDSRVRKLATELDALKKEHNAARRQAAMDALEREFAGDVA